MSEQTGEAKVSPTPTQTLQAIIDSGELEGYTAGFYLAKPGLIDGAAIDAQCCAESVCEECGHAGLESHPYTSADRSTYRVFAVCPECGKAEEF